MIERLLRRWRETRTDRRISAGMVVMGSETALKGIAIRLPSQQARRKEENSPSLHYFPAGGNNQQFIDLPCLSLSLSASQLQYS